MEEEECDYRTPIGKVIKHINTLCKKPQIDNRLSEALDLFNEKLEDQEKYVIEGIMKVNFAEAALFLQCSTELYGKKIDVLWDELLEFHTRLITYDCEDKKKKGLAIDKDVIEKLEERRNRYKRKKLFKLMLKNTISEAQKFKCFLFDDEEKENNAKKTAREQEKVLKSSWKNFESYSREMRKIPNIVYKQMTQRYRMKNYPLLKGQDFEILDLEDGDFNIKYSRVPSWHHVHHLFEYNDKGLLPDNNNIIAILRLSTYGRVRFMASRGIPFNTPFEEYKEEYMKYREEFFAEEAKKWQNMPLNTLEDLHKQLRFLAQKERAEKGEPVVVGETVKVGRYGVKVVDRPIENEKIEILDSSDEDSLFELSFSCDQNYMKSELYIRLEKLSSEIVNKKLRQDSGFFEFNSDSDHDCDDVNLNFNEKEGDGAATTADGNSTVINTETKVDILADNGTDICKDATGGDSITQDNKDTNVDEQKILCKVGYDSSIISQDTKDEANAHVYKDDNAQNQMNEHSYAGLTKADDPDINNDNFETRSFISDHDYCLTIPPSLEISIENNSMDSGINENTENAKSDSTDNNLKNNNPINGIKPSLNKTVEEAITKPLSSASRIVPRVVKIKEKDKRKIPKGTSDGESPPKRRKLSQKQIEKLLESKIKPVKLNKFENFFSMNYISEFGEGDVTIVDYESDFDSEESDSVYPDVDSQQHCANENNTNADQANVDLSVHEDNTDTQSLHSDHDYCRPSAKDAHNDSGFLEAFSSQPLAEDESTQKDQQENSFSEPSTSQNTAGEDSAISLENEYERALAELRKGSTEYQNQPEIGPRLPTARELQEIEEENIHERVEEWRNRITPILRNLREEEFDIHEYGSKIMDGLEINASKPFSEMVQGKSSAEVVRYFISSLQLANTNNIEICGAQQGRLSNDTYHVKLLTKDRYHEHLNEYLAPSEETLREKLDRMRAMNADKVNSGQSPTKKFKLIVTPSKPKRNARGYTTNRKPVIKNKITPLSSSNHNIQVMPSTPKVVLPNENAVAAHSSYQITSCKVILSPIAREQQNKISSVDVSQENFNNNEIARQERLLAKGKSIIKRPIANRSQEPYILNADISMPSTSRQIPWPDSYAYSETDAQIPSTSFPRFTPSPDLDEMGFPRDFTIPSTSFDEGSSNQIRRESTEELFRERLLTAQEMNPDVQLQSTPNDSSPSKKLKTFMFSKRSLQFE